MLCHLPLPGRRHDSDKETQAHNMNSTVARTTDFSAYSGHDEIYQTWLWPIEQSFRGTCCLTVSEEETVEVQWIPPDRNRLTIDSKTNGRS